MIAMARRAAQVGGALLLVMAAGPLAGQTAGPSTGTPPEIVATYRSLADSLLALKRTEEELCRAILSAGVGHGHSEQARAQKALAAGDAKTAQGAVESLAAIVGNLATEGDAAVGSVRKKLLDGGHHHNAAGEAQGIFDEGYVIVTKAAKAKLLESSRAIAQMSSAPKAPELNAEWRKVQTVYTELTQPAK